MYNFGIGFFFSNQKPGQPPDFSDAIILRRGVTVEHVCHAVHRTLASQFKYALVWGTSTKYSPQRVGIGHIMNDEGNKNILL